MVIPHLPHISESLGVQFIFLILTSIETKYVSADAAFEPFFRTHLIQCIMFGRTTSVFIRET